MRQRVAVAARELSEDVPGKAKRSMTMKGGASRSSPILMGSPNKPLPQRRHSEWLRWKSAQMELDVSDSDVEQDRVADEEPPPSGSTKKNG